MEWSVDVKTEIWVKSCSWLWFGNISIKDLPLLVHSIMSLVHLNISVFSVNATRYIKYLTFLICNVVTLKSEELEPSSVGVPYLQVARSTSVSNVQRSTSVCNRFDSLCGLVEDEFLGASVVDSGLDYKISSSNNFDNSVHPHLGDNVEWSIDKESKVGVQSLDFLSAD